MTVAFGLNVLLNEKHYTVFRIFIFIYNFVRSALSCEICLLFYWVSCFLNRILCGLNAPAMFN